MELILCESLLEKWHSPLLPSLAAAAAPRRGGVSIRYKAYISHCVVK